MTPYDLGHDEDGDGCTDWNELGEDVALGGLNDPFNPTDCSVVITAPGLYDVSQSFASNSHRFCKAYVQADYKTRAFCYLDSSLVVNLLGYPGVTGDGVKGGALDGGGPWWPKVAAVGPPENATSQCGRVNPVDDDGDTVVNDGCPAGGFADTDSTATLLSGELDAGTNTLKLRGCFRDEDASTALGNVYVEWSWDVQTGAGSSDMWTLQSFATCIGSYAWGTYSTVAGPPLPAYDDVYLAALKRPASTPQTPDGQDSDLDGAPDEAELRDDATNQTTGLGCGLRDPFNPYDFYDVNSDGVIDLLTDILGVIQHYQPAAGGAPPYDILYDRPSPITGGAGSWSRGEPDGVIDLLNDILGVIQQYHPAPC